MGIRCVKKHDSCHKHDAVVRHGKGELHTYPNLTLIRDESSFSDIIAKCTRMNTEKTPSSHLNLVGVIGLATGFLHPRIACVAWVLSLAQK